MGEIMTFEESIFKSLGDLAKNQEHITDVIAKLHKKIIELDKRIKTLEEEKK